jgi:hypothetical protein
LPQALFFHFFGVFYIGSTAFTLKRLPHALFSPGFSFFFYLGATAFTLKHLLQALFFPDFAFFT